MTESTVKAVLSKNIQKYRKIRNLTQSELAEKCNLSTTYIANIECGRPWVSDKSLEKIAIALQVKIFMLFVDDDDINNEENSDSELNKLIDMYKNKINDSVSNIIDDFSFEYKKQFYKK